MLLFLLSSQCLLIRFQPAFYFLDIFASRKILWNDTTLEHHVTNSLVVINMLLTDRLLTMQIFLLYVD